MGRKIGFTYFLKSKVDAKKNKKFCTSPPGPSPRSYWPYSDQPWPSCKQLCNKPITTTKSLVGGGDGIDVRKLPKSEEDSANSSDGMSSAWLSDLEESASTLSSDAEVDDTEQSTTSDWLSSCGLKADDEGKEAHKESDELILAAGSSSTEAEGGCSCVLEEYYYCRAVTVTSEDPYWDFRHSMEEMVLGAAHYSFEEVLLELESTYMQQMLECYLRLNGDENHEIILDAFVDLLAAM